MDGAARGGRYTSCSTASKRCGSLKFRAERSTESRHMADIYPFRALHYNPAMVGNLERVVTQPYDKITAEMQERYYEQSPYNLVRIIRGRHNPDDSARDN